MVDIKRMGFDEFVAAFLVQPPEESIDVVNTRGRLVGTWLPSLLVAKRAKRGVVSAPTFTPWPKPSQRG